MKTAILIPCYNEELTIAKVIQDFRKELPEAEIYVYDNNSKDKTAEIAQKNGAIVKHEYHQGKGNVIKSMFRDIDAEIYIIVDGDDTYPAKDVHKLIKPVQEARVDMVTGDRQINGRYKKENKRPFHKIGNNLVTKLINILFHSDLKDVMTGYRVLNRNIVKEIQIESENFEIETEITLFAIKKKLLIEEIPIIYKERIAGSVSKLKTFKDGAKIIKTIIKMIK